MKKSVKKRKNPIIALAQIKYFDTSEKHNISKIKKYIQLAKSENADIICFPESTVHSKDFLNFNHKLISEIKEECRKNSIWCIIDDDMTIGKVIKRTYNTAILINRNGKIEGEYRKMHLMGDSPSVKSGKKIGIFKTDFGKIGIAVCWDLAYPKLFRRMKQKGAEIIFCPAYWKYEARAHHPTIYNERHRRREFETLKSLVMSRAFENLFFVALCNPARNKYEKDLISYSAIASPHKIISDIKDREGLITAEIKLNEIGKLEKIYKEAV